MVLLLSGCSKPSVNNEPVAERANGNDPYGYLSDRTNPQTDTYIRAEQKYFEAATQAWQSDIALLAREVNRDLPVTRQNPPVISDGSEFSARIDKGTQYPVYHRRIIETGEMQVLLDVNERAKNSQYYRLGGFSLSPDGQEIAFTEDVRGSGLYALYVRELANGDVRKLAEGVEASLGWLGKRIVYIADAKVQMLSPGGESQLVFQEADPAFALSIASAGDDGTLLITAESHSTTEVMRLLQTGDLQTIAERKEGHRYRIRVSNEKLLILSNLNHPDFGFALADPGDPIERWWFVDTPSIERITDFEPVASGVYLHTRDGLRHGIFFLSLEDLRVRRIYDADVGEQIAFHTLGPNGELRFWKRSPLVPDQYVEFSQEEREIVLSVGVTPPGFDQDLYVLEQIEIEARDGTRVPVTITYRQGEPLDQRPMLLTAYGAYGFEQDLRFDPSRLPLLRRGVIVAWVHVRGGGDLGAQWRSAGQEVNKTNTVNDFEDAASALPELGYGMPGKLAGRFASAGGVIAGYIINESPQLLSAVVTRAPFVDVVTTLLDENQLLTASDRLEWGDPRDPDMLALIKSYSPYNNVRKQSGPDLLILAGLNDRSVPIHESLKWLARLRFQHPEEALMLIDIEENSGHLGATDQYLRRQQTALELVFLINRLGIRI